MFNLDMYHWFYIYNKHKNKTYVDD